MCKLGKKELTKPIIQVIPDFLIIEGPKAGGHLGFSNEQLSDLKTINFDQEVRDIVACKKEYEEKFQTCGANVGRINKITTVHDLMQELIQA